MIVLDYCGFENEILVPLHRPKKSTSLSHAIPGNIEESGRKHPEGG